MLALRIGGTYDVTKCMTGTLTTLSVLLQDHGVY